jgi:tetratricopeptide (TPR) repeat protein
MNRTPVHDTGQGNCPQVAQQHEAEQRLRHAIDASPNAAAHADLGRLLEQQQRYSEAEQHYRQAVLLDAAATSYRYRLANLLAGATREQDREEAKALLLEIIRHEPANAPALNCLGALLFQTGYTSAALTVYSALAAHHPQEIGAHANLGRVLLHRDQLAEAQQHFAIALEMDPESAAAHQGLAAICQRQGDEQRAAFHRLRGFGSQPVVTLPYRGSAPPIRMLILASAQEGNIPWRLLIDYTRFELTTMIVEYVDLSAPLPAHDLIFNAIGDADLCMAALDIAGQIAALSNAPVINRPARVQKTGRLANAVQLRTLPGIIAPRMAHLRKTQIADHSAPAMLAQAGAKFPILLRAPGFHGGSHFCRVEDPDALQTAAATLPGDDLLAIEFLDPRAPDGLFRKYRIMSIDACLYPVHMAVSAEWKVHYYTSGMDTNATGRSEEAAFLNDFRACLGPQAVTALERIAEKIGLDYCGMDFGIDAEGNVMLYEANATMAIIPPTHELQWDYKRDAVDNAIAAAKRMFARRSAAQAVT